MKNRIIFLILFLSGIASAFAQNSAPLRSKFNIYKLYLSPTIKVVPKRSSLPDFVDAYYSADNVVSDANGVVSALKPVKGNYDIPYSGIPSPTLQRPYLLNGEVVFKNQPYASFKKQVRDNKNPYPLPEEMTIVFRKMPGTNYEALISGWGNYYIGFAEINKIRAATNSTYFPSSNSLKFYELSFIHVRFEDNGDGTPKAKAWINGTYIGELKSTDKSWPRRMSYGVGIETNATDNNWKATMFIERGLSDEQRSEYFSLIKQTYNIGSMPAYPYASNINKTIKNGKWVVSYKYNGKNPENVSKVQYRWYKCDPDLTHQTLIGTGTSVPYDPKVEVKVCVKVTDVNGLSWMYISGTYNYAQ